ncbi:hypothetical protein [Actinomadura rubrisoli]|uniref:Uncharacterized protein n=1 Tax=Actinomadura rubrisoli TaxID=2530368 RepID=A0A4R5C125_9ACTN|nr:hypothetical protein [Actinomadura rubrisoli]TDD92219.1 hypothetical protein E1298_10890 [Actinomadura rubrisoli]
MSRENENDRRRLNLVFAAFCLVAAVLALLPEDPARPAVQMAAGYGYPIAAVLVAAAALRRARRTLIVSHLLLVPVQFVFSFGGGFAPLGGMIFSVVAAVLMRPRFPQLRRRARRVWLTLHVGVSVGWLGLSLAMTTLAVAGATAGGHAVRHGAYELMHVFDLAIVIPSVVMAIATGLVVSLGTPWGVLKHWWVLLKLVIALVIPVIATVQSTWIEELRARTADPAGEPGGLGLTLVICMACYALLLWTAVALSVFKPGGKTRWGRAASRPAPRRRTTAAPVETRI